jgi:hypothetical protein
MIGKLIGAAIGERAAREMSGGNQVVGAVVGAVALPLLRRLGPTRLLALASGGYAMKYLIERSREAPNTADKLGKGSSDGQWMASFDRASN